MDPKDLTKLSQQEHFMLDTGIYLVFKHVTLLDHLSRIKIDAAHENIKWELTNGHCLEYQVMYNHNHRIESLMNTFVAESLDSQKHLTSTIDQYIYLTNLPFPLGKSYQNPEHFSNNNQVTLYSRDMNDDQKNFVREHFKNSPLKSSAASFKKFFTYFWKRFVIEQPNFNEDDDISRNNQLLSELLKSLQKDYQIEDNDLLILARLLKPIRQILNCNLWANAFDYQHHVYVTGSKIQSLLQTDLVQLKKK